MRLNKMKIEDTVDQENDDEALPPNEPLLGQFLKLPVEKVATHLSNPTAEHLRLSRSSQLLTSEDYITLLVEAEHKKKEMQVLKEKKKTLAKEKKEARAVAEENQR